MDQCVPIQMLFLSMHLKHPSAPSYRANTLSMLSHYFKHNVADSAYMVWALENVWALLNTLKNELKGDILVVNIYSKCHKISSITLWVILIILTLVVEVLKQNMK